MPGSIIGYTANFNFKKVDFNVATWHDYFYEFQDTLDAVLTQYFAVPEIQGVWDNSLVVTANQVYVDSTDGSLWEAQSGFTTPATGTFAEERVAYPARWSTATPVTTGGYSFPTLNASSVGKTLVVNGTYNGFNLQTLGALALLNTIATAYVDDNAITLAKLGHGTQGDIFYCAAAGAPTFLAAGTAGYALVTGGAGANPAFQQLGTSGIQDAAITLAKMASGTRGGMIAYQGASATPTLLGPGTVNYPLVAKGAGADLVFEQLATGGIADAAVTLAKMANLAQSTIIGRQAGGGTGVPEALTAAQARAAAGLGTVATLNTGTANGDIPLIGATGIPAATQADNTMRLIGYGTYTANSDLSTVAVLDNTEPLIAEGTQLIQITGLAASSNNSEIVVEIEVNVAGAASTLCIGHLHKDSASAAIKTFTVAGISATEPMTVCSRHKFTPGNTTTFTLELIFGPEVGTVRCNGSTSAGLFNGTMACVMAVYERRKA